MFAAGNRRPLAAISAGKRNATPVLDLLFAAVGWFAITEERSQVVTFSTPLHEAHYRFFIQNPAELYNLKAYTSTLTKWTWLMFLAWIIITPPILFILAR